MKENWSQLLPAEAQLSQNGKDAPKGEESTAQHREETLETKGLRFLAPLLPYRSPNESNQTHSSMKKFLNYVNLLPLVLLMTTLYVTSVGFSFDPQRTDQVNPTIVSPAAAKRSLVVKGYVYHDYRPVQRATVRLYRGSEVIKTLDVEDSNMFKMKIPVDDYYVLEIERKGFYPKYVIFETQLEGQPLRDNRFEFEVQLYRDKDLEGLETAVLDFPAGIVRYNSKTQKFAKVTKYAEGLVDEYDALDFGIELKQAQASN